MIRRRGLSLTMRLTVAFTVCSVALVLIATLYLYWSLVNALNYRDEKFFLAKIEALRSLVSRSDDGQALRYRVEKEWPAQKSEVFFVRLLDEQGKILAETPEGREIFSHSAMSAETLPQGSETEILNLPTALYRILRTTVSEPPRRYTVRIALDRTEDTLLLAEYRNRLAIVFALCLIVSVLVCYEITRQGLRPLRRMAETAAKISSSNLDERMRSTEMPSELSHLAKSFDAMLDRLSTSFDQLQRFSADIAHELRTPVNNISGELQLALSKERSADYYKDAIGSSLEECSRISRIIDSLLFLAHAENPRIQIAKEPINLRKELEGALEFYEPAAGEKGISCELRMGKEITLQAERTLFQRAIGNLLSNAINNNERAGVIEVDAVCENNEVKITVSDTGVGIAEEHLPNVFDRFYRVDESRNKRRGGSGLGLAIVKSIATIHGGEVKIFSRLGQGTQVCLSLPL